MCVSVCVCVYVCVVLMFMYVWIRLCVCVVVCDCVYVCVLYWCLCMYEYVCTFVCVFFWAFLIKHQYTYFESTYCMSASMWRVCVCLCVNTHMMFFLRAIIYRNGRTTSLTLLSARLWRHVLRTVTPAVWVRICCLCWPYVFSISLFVLNQRILRAAIANLIVYPADDYGMNLKRDRSSIFTI